MKARQAVLARFPEARVISWGVRRLVGFLWLPEPDVYVIRVGWDTISDQKRSARGAWASAKRRMES